MPKITMVCGILLTLLGVICYIFWEQLHAEHQSVTALIPAFIGVPIFLMGWLSLAKPAMRMHFMHVAVTLGLLGGLASLGRLIAVLIKHPSLGIGPIASFLMTLICGVFVVLCVKSFIAARKARKAAQRGFEVLPMNHPN